ncbi:MAG TPA: cytochrome b/b6 domain-containing protein [Alphaproteobacteria bacterium]
MREFDSYDRVAKGLHWLIAALLAVQYVIAYFMPHIGRNTPNEGLVNLHLSFGGLILVLVILRLAWRLTHPVPPPGGTAARWLQIATRTGHGLLYAVLLIMPLMGGRTRGFAASR